MAVTIASPSATAFTRPVASTLTTLGFEEVNFALLVRSPSILPEDSASTRSRWLACGPERTTLPGRILISAPGEAQDKARRTNELKVLAMDISNINLPGLHIRLPVFSLPGIR